MDKEIMGFGLSGKENEIIFNSIGDIFFENAPNCRLCVVDDKTKKKIKDWRKGAALAKRDFFSKWEDSTYLSYQPEIVKFGVLIPAGLTSINEVMNLFERITFKLASFAPLFYWRKAFDYIPPTFSDHHFTHGWGCAFQGEGHERLVSRRWLTYGPWHTLKGDNDTTLVLFHDPDASMEVAYQQGKVGHERMGISPTGGFLQTDYVYNTELKGKYSFSEKRLRVVVHGREVSQEEMLDACAARIYHPFGEDKPVERVAFLFLEEENARKHLHELWLRELECWTIIKGKMERIDLDYKPKVVKPDWVLALAKRLK